MPCPPTPRGRSFALRNLTVQRASVSFCAALAGSPGQISRGGPPLLDRGLLRCAGALARSRDQRRVQHLAGTGDEARRVDHPLKLRGQRIQLARLDQRLAEGPQRVRVRDPVGDAETAEAHPAKPIPHRLLGRFKRKPMAALEHEHPELRQDIEGRAAALGTLGLPRRPLEDRAKPLEINHRLQSLKRVAVHGNLRQACVDALLRRGIIPSTAPGLAHRATRSRARPGPGPNPAPWNPPLWEVKKGCR